MVFLNPGKSGIKEIKNVLKKLEYSMKNVEISEKL